MSEWFETTMIEMQATPAQTSELEAAYRQTKQGFELVVARAQQGDSPVGLLLSLIRNGAHLKAAAISKDERSAGGLFKCNWCGVLGNTNAEQHHSNFPEHKAGKPTPPPAYPDPIPWIAPERRSRQDWADLRAAITMRDRGATRTEDKPA